MTALRNAALAALPAVLIIEQAGYAMRDYPTSPDGYRARLVSRKSR